MRCLPRFVEIAEGLAHAHENGIVHRDLKPSNVVIMQGPQGEQAKVLDFGVAKNIGATPEQKATATGSIVGSPLYMSPEQFSGRVVDALRRLFIWLSALRAGRRTSAFCD